MTKLEIIAQKYDLKYLPADKIAVGQVKGLPCTISSTEYNYMFNVEINVNVQASGKMPELTQEVKAKTKAFKSVLNFVLSNHAIKVQINVSSTKKIDELDEVFDYIATLVSENGLRNCCTACGESKPTETYSINGEGRQICSSCGADIINTLEYSEIENRAKKGSIPLGIVGAFVGALIAGVLWVLIYQLNYIVAIVGYLAIVCSYKGYVMLSGKKDVKAALISIVVAAGVLFLAHCFCWSLMIATELDFPITIAIQATPTVIFDPANIVSFFGDLLIGYLFMAIGAFSFIKNAIKNPTGKAQVKLLETASTNL